MVGKSMSANFVDLRFALGTALPGRYSVAASIGLGIRNYYFPEREDRIVAAADRELYPFLSFGLDTCQLSGNC
jgi:hypothetical protein